jgi:hypothetical protein
MDQWIIDRYNKGQDKYFLKRDIFNFLFNPKWGFAKAFWSDKEVTKCCGEEYDPDRACFACGNPSDWIHLYEYHLQQMVISKDPIKYLEQFKEK